MKRVASAVLLILLLSVAGLSADKYVAKEYGFSVSFPGPVQQEVVEGQANIVSASPDQSMLVAVSTFTLTKDVPEDQIYTHLEAGVAAFGNNGFAIKKTQRVTFQGFLALKFTFVSNGTDGEHLAGIGMITYVPATRRVYYIIAETRPSNPNVKACYDALDSFEILK